MLGLGLGLCKKISTAPPRLLREVTVPRWLFRGAFTEILLIRQIMTSPPRKTLLTVHHQPLTYDDKNKPWIVGVLAARYLPCYAPTIENASHDAPSFDSLAPFYSSWKADKINALEKTVLYLSGVSSADIFKCRRFQIRWDFVCGGAEGNQANLKNNS